MVDTGPKRPLTSEVADDIGAGFGVPGDNRPHAQQEQINLEEGGGYQRDDHEYRIRHGGGGGEYEGGEGGRMRQKEDDPLDNAAMTLTALSSGVRDLERSTSRSGFQGFSGQQAGATKRGAERFQTERGGESMTPSYSEKPLRYSQETFADATILAGGGPRQQHQQQQEQQQRQQSAMQPLSFPLPPSAAITPPSSSSALSISALTASESTSPISAQEEVVSRDTPITPQEHTSRAPGERMQSLSHMLKDRLSLVPFRAEQGWDTVDVDMSEQRITREVFREPARRADLQHYHDYHERPSPSHQNELSAHPIRFLRDRPKTPSAGLSQGQDKSTGRQQWEFSHDSRSQQHRRDFQQRLQLPRQLLQPQKMQQPHHRSQSSSSIRDDRGPSHWITQISPSPIMDPIVAKPKRKYTKKSSLLPQARAETHDQVDLQTRQEKKELLYSDRGLILKTQIPKKGRPISKHSTTSSQSTPTLTSLGILPASHHYFSKTGTPSSSSSSSAMSSLVAATAARSPSDSTLSTHSSSSQGAHPSVMSDQRGAVISQTGRRPGRPPPNPSLPRHAHSQSYSNEPPISLPPPHSGQARPLPSPTAHEFDLHFTRYKDRRTPQELDNNRFSAYQDRSPTLSISTTASSQQLSFRHHQLPEYQVPISHRRYVSSPIDQEFSGEELEYRNVEGDPRYPERRRRTVDTPSVMPPRSFAEGVTVQMNTLKRSSSGIQKSLSMDGYHSQSIENRGSVGGGSVGSGERGTMVYGADGQFEDVNEEPGSNFFDEEFDDSAAGARSRKRTSGSDLDYSGIGGIGPRRVGNADGGNVRRSVNQQGGNKTWHEATLGSERRRPRSLVLPNGRGEPTLPWTNMLDSGSGSGSRSGSGSMVGVLPGQGHLDIEDDEIDYREMMILTPAIAIGPPSTPPPAILSSSSNSLMILGDTRGKGRGGRSMHSHARSLDISSFSAPSHRGHRPLSPSNLDRPFRHDMYSTKELLPEQQRGLTSGRRLYASSSSSLNSPPFGDNLSIRSDQGIFNTDARGIPSSTDHHGYNHLDTTSPPPITTRADFLAREMMSGTHSIHSGGGSGRGRGRRGSSHGHNHMKSAMFKRSTSKRGLGPHLKKHQILQQQLYQIQRDQEEMDLQMALQLQQRQMQQQQHLEQEQEQGRQGLEEQRKLKQQKQQQQQRKVLHSQRHQHSQSLQLQHEFSSPELNLQQQQQEQQQQPRPGRPTKQRVLFRSESAMAILHGMHSPPLGSTLSQSQSQPSLSQSATAITSSNSSTLTPQPPSRRRQNQQQPILLRPVSLPSLTGSSGNGGGGGSGSGAAGMDFGSSPPYLMNHPPPGQPLFRSLHAPYLVSPSSLVSVASNVSSSTGTTGTGVTLATLEPGQGGGDERDEEDEDGDGDRSRRISSPVKSPHTSYSTTPPLTTGLRMFTSPYSHHDGQGYPPHPQPYQPHHHHQQQQQSNHSHHHHPYQHPSHHSVNTSNISPITSLHQDSLSTDSSITAVSKRSSHPPGTNSMSRSNSRGGMSTSSSATTLVQSSTSQSSLCQHQQHHQHRHSSSLPSLNYYYQSSTASSSSTSPQHPLDQKHQQNQQQRMSNTPLPIPQNDPTRPPIHRMISQDTQPPALHPHKYTSSSTTAIHPPTPGAGSQPSITTTITTTVGEEESVERLLIRTPLGDV